MGVGSRLCNYRKGWPTQEEKLHLQEEEKLRKDKEVSLPEARTNLHRGSMLWELWFRMSLRDFPWVFHDFTWCIVMSQFFDVWFQRWHGQHSEVSVVPVVSMKTGLDRSRSDFKIVSRHVFFIFVRPTWNVDPDWCTLCSLFFSKQGCIF